MLYLHFVFPAFIFHLFLLADRNTSRAKVKYYMAFLTFMAIIGFLTGSKSMFLFIFFAWGFYIYFWEHGKNKNAKLAVIFILGLISVLSIHHLRGNSIKGMMAVKPRSTGANITGAILAIPWQIPVIPLAPYQTATCIEMAENQFSLEGQSYRNLPKMLIPLLVASKLGIERPEGGANIFATYAASAGGMNMVGEAYWNLGVYGSFIVFFILAVIYNIIDRIAVKYKWTGKSISLYLAYASLVGLGYGTSALFRALQFAVFLLILTSFCLYKKNQPNEA